jgi:hypothetical protein
MQKLAFIASIYTERWLEQVPKPSLFTFPPKTKNHLILTESGVHRYGYRHAYRTTIHHEDCENMLLLGVKGQKHKISKTLPDDPMVVILTLLMYLVHVVDDPIKAMRTRHVFWNKHENTHCRKTADSFLNGINTTFEDA